jgi:RNA polymerase sigma-70 factor (ECF subfamily)
MSDDRTDVQAILACRNPPLGQTPGEEDAHVAFGRIFDRHSAVVRALCRSHCPSETDADDALQETFIRAYRRIDQVNDPEHLRTWLYAIARLVCSERRRSAVRRTKHEHAAAEERHTMNGTLGGNHTVSSHAHSRPPAESAERREQLEHLTKALDDLPDEERLAIHLYYLESDPIAAAQDALGLSRSGFYKLLARARGRLAGVLGNVAS